MMQEVSRAPLTAAVLAVAAAAAIQVGYHAAIGLGADDVGPFETVLARAVAGHFEAGVGPGRFYGPFDGAYPSVLMHAPLYYRLAALVAWPFVALGGEPLACSLFAGRALSALGTTLLLWLTFRLARLDGAGRRAGWVSALLLGASPLFGNLMTMLRPDALGVALQTAVAWLGLRAIGEGEPAARRVRLLVLAAVLAALGFLMKQHNVTVAAALGPLVLLAWRRGVLPARAIACAIVAGLGTVALVLAVETVVTGGRMGQTVFVYPSGPFRAINYAGWVHVGSVFDITARRSLALVGLAVAGAWIVGRRVLVPTLDRVLLLFLGVELVALVPLCLYNAGAASNYALQAAVFASMLVGRLLDRAASIAPDRRGWVGSAAAFAAGAFLLAADGRWIVQAEGLRRREREAASAIAGDDVSPASRYFVERQHLNRLHGRSAMIHDDWLYGAFEQVGGAEPRRVWLRAALVDGPIREVVTPARLPSRVPGVEEPLDALGYREVARVADFCVWRR